MKKLSRENLKQAETFLGSQARPLEQALFATFFRGAPAEWALSELAAFQNSDGGFGHGLEPDVQMSSSSILATTVALQHLRALQVSAGHPLVLGAVRYLMDTYDSEAVAWPFVPPQVDAAPHAPWWQYNADLSQYLANPRAEIVGFLFDYAELVPADLCETLLTAVTEYLEDPAVELTMHELLCYVRLVETESLPADAHDRLLSELQPLLNSGVATDPSTWDGYVLKPLMVAPSPASLFAESVQKIIGENLDFEIDRQQKDGSWAPNWSWGEAYPEAWFHAKRAWKGVLTVNMINALLAYGRVEL
jgi:hypothetical protein